MRPFPLLLILACSPALAGGFQSWVPPGWKLVQQQHGDLNGDSRSDAVLVIEGTDPAKHVKNEELGEPDLNLNPRRLLVLLAKGQGYEKAVDNAEFLPGPNDAEAPCLADPLDGSGVSIRRGSLVIHFNYWQSCGSWGSSEVTYRFRLEDRRLRLTGIDSGEFMRNSGERSERSYNLLTGKCKITTGLNEFEPARGKVEWKTLPIAPPVHLEQLGSSGSGTGIPAGCAP
ncbi:hypothetical protein [Chitinilyticum aquatile]|uniref:hypothetical protein n=1 Tax=Chitinilyticum aquatile TaxID=362520 RepID=UPI000417B591|nr:hypothetical protein [Chitinilyticum aquatile]